MTATLRGEFHKIIGENKNLDEIAYGKLRSVLVANMTLNIHYEITSFIDQRSIAFCLSMKGLFSKEIHQKLVQTLGFQAVAYPTVTWHLHAAKFPAQSKKACDAEDSVDAGILKTLTDNPFPSVRDLSRLTCLSRSAVHRRLTDSLGFTLGHLNWIPHQLSDHQGQLASRAPASAAKAATPRVVQHLDSG
jgi:hypothetical protein